MALEPVAVPAQAAPRQARLTVVVASLTAAKLIGAASGLITGPLLARSLGAAGRGDLAAITVPLAVAPAVLGLGISAFPYRDLPRGRRVQEVVGSLGVPTLLLGCLGVVVAVPVADALAGGREVVRVSLIVCFALMPVLLMGELLYSCVAGLGRWRAVVVSTVIPFEVPFVSIVGLYAVGHLTVGAAAAATIAGAVFAIIPCLPTCVWLSGVPLVAGAAGSQLRPEIVAGWARAACERAARSSRP